MLTKVITFIFLFPNVINPNTFILNVINPNTFILNVIDHKHIYNLSLVNKTHKNDFRKVLMMKYILIQSHEQHCFLTLVHA